MKSTFLAVAFVLSASLVVRSQSAPQAAPEAPKPEANAGDNKCLQIVKEANQYLDDKISGSTKSPQVRMAMIESVVTSMKAQTEDCTHTYGWNLVVAKAYLFKGVVLCQTENFKQANRVFAMVYNNALTLAKDAEKNNYPMMRDYFIWIASKAYAFHNRCNAAVVDIATPEQLTDVSVKVRN